MKSPTTHTVSPNRVLVVPTPHTATKTEIPKWYALYTRSKFERKVFDTLKGLRHEAFLPLIKEKRKWSDRLKTVETPLFPGYVFVRVTAATLPQMLWIPGVARFVGFCGKPSEIQKSDIQLMDLVIKHGLPAANQEGCCPGDRVRILRGPLKDWEGRVARLNGTHKVLFEFESIGQVIGVEIGVGEVEVVG
jgi:transcriptional antiterminator RfaH